MAWHCRRGWHYSAHSAEIIIHIGKVKFDYIPQNIQKLFQTTKALNVKGKMFWVYYRKTLLWHCRVNHFLKLDKIITVEKWRVMCVCVCLVTPSCPTLNSTYLKMLCELLLWWVPLTERLCKFVKGLFICVLVKGDYKN